MCGICCFIARDFDHPETIVKHEKLRQLLRKRGPDASDSQIVCWPGHRLTISSDILWTQGNDLQAQPMMDHDKSIIFAFNGDIYSFATHKLENDGLQLFNLISKCNTDIEFTQLISQLQGPFAFILVENHKKRIWFARDFFGRSSLVLAVLSTSNDDKGIKSFFLSSVAPVSQVGNVCEIPSAGLFCLSLEETTDYLLTIYPWNVQHCRVDMQDHFTKFKTFLEQKLSNIKFNLKEDMKVSCVATKLKPFHVVQEFNINVDRDYLRELNDVITNTGLKRDDGLILLKIKDILDDQIQQFLYHLRKAVKLRVDLKPSFCKSCVLKKIQNSTAQPCNHSKIGVLFSGGLDSTVLAYLIAEILDSGDSLDLINVAFSSDEKQNFTNVPDRQTGLQSYHVLQQIFEPCGIHLNFVEVNVTKSEVENIRLQYILDLVSPLQSVLDDSIGCCLWFASRAKGIVRKEQDYISYTSPARILFVGSGADELLGGYSRHRSAFEVRGWQGLLDEMQQDIDRISMRNLGRDNRIITNHGVCPRMPFLDENVVHFITQECQLWVKCCPSLPRGVGEKLLLRATAASLLGKEHVNLALFHKRAIQFGSRLAKLENSKEKGGDVCERLKAQSPT